MSASFGLTNPEEKTHMSKLADVILGLAIVFMFVLSLASASGSSADEQAIRQEATAWARAALDKDLEKTVSYYADDAHMYPFNAPRTENREDIRKVWRGFFSAPGAVLDAKTTSITAAKSGELAYETGTFEFTQNDAQGQPTKTPGKYVVVWKKQKNGQWKAVADIFNTDK
jgi:uncharacterized protein (TIGR02246 family)